MVKRGGSIRISQWDQFSKNEKIFIGGLAIATTGGLAATALSGTAVGAGIGTGVRYFGYARRPVLSYGVHQGYRGASTLMGFSKAYAATMLAHGIYELDKNIALARNKEYKRLGINLMGPPGSLWLYDQLYNGPAKESLASSSSPSQQNGGAKGKKNNSKTSKRYPLFSDHAGIFSKSGRVLHNPCAKGYVPKLIKGRAFCVKK